MSFGQLRTKLGYFYLKTISVAKQNPKQVKMPLPNIIKVWRKYNNIKFWYIESHGKLHISIKN